jgi:hypothetical protein
LRPHRLKNVPSTATVTGAPSGIRYFTIRRATASPSSSASQAASEKNQQALRKLSAIPAAAARATTVRRPARIIPHASIMNKTPVDRRRNTGVSSLSRSRQVAGIGRLTGGSIIPVIKRVAGAPARVTGPCSL